MGHPSNRRKGAEDRFFVFRTTKNASQRFRAKRRDLRSRGTTLFRSLAIQAFPLSPGIQQYPAHVNGGYRSHLFNGTAPRVSSASSLCRLTPAGGSLSAAPKLTSPYHCVFVFLFEAIITPMPWHCQAIKEKFYIFIQLLQFLKKIVGNPLAF